MTQVGMAQVSWYEDLPSSWVTGRIKSVSRRVTDGAHISPETNGGAFDFVSTKDLKDGVIDFAGSLKTSPATYEYMVRTGCKPWPGDLLFSKDGTVGTTALVDDECDFVVASSLIIVSPDCRRTLPRFLLHAFSARPVIEQARTMTRGAGLPRLSVGNLARIEIALPPLDEQRVIIDFLDHETAQIDALVAKQGEFVALLRERRTAVIERAIGRFAWRVPLRTASSLIQTGPFGSQLKSDEYINGGVPVINPSHLGGGFISEDPRVTISKEKAVALSRHALRTGDLVAARRGELGRCAVVTEREEGFLCGTGSALVRPDMGRLRPYFLKTVFSGRKVREMLSLQSVGATMDNLNADIIGALRIPVPSLEEQDRCLRIINENFERLDSLIAKAQELIAFAKERRAALITAAVTGQIDVRTVRKAG
jgi:type I restriction enzyme, S subunit